MKPPPFEYHDPETIDEALDLLAGYGDEAKILAGGQSLVPILNFRLARPAALIDINRLPLAGIERRDGVLRIGALTRHIEVERSALVGAACPVLAAAVPRIGHRQIRNRGTFGGSLAHADPAAELPLIVTLLDADIRTIRPAGGTGSYRPADFFLGYLTTVLAADEIVVEIRLPALAARTGWAFAEVSPRAGDFALVAAAATLDLTPERTVAGLRLALGGASPAPVRLSEVEAVAHGRPLDARLLDDLAGIARAAVDPEADIHASAEYRRDVAATLVRRVVSQAAGRAEGGSGG